MKNLDRISNAPFQRITKWATVLEQWAAVALLVLVLTATFSQVAARFVFDSPLSWTDELARYSYVWLTFIAAAAVMARQEHITVELGGSRLGPITKVVLNIFGMLIVLLVCVVLTFGAVEMLQHRASGVSTGMGIPMSIFYGTVWIGLILMGLHAAGNILRLIFLARNPREAEKELQETTRLRAEKGGL